MANPQHETREQQADREVGHTEVHPATAWAMIAIFLSLITLVSVWEVVAQMRAGQPIAAAGLFTNPPSLSDFTFPIHRSWQSERNPLHDFEKSVEAASPPRLLTQRPMQWLLSTAGAGNSTVVRGTGDWLYYRPGIDYVAGPDFSGPAWALIRPRRHPDAGAAIRALNAACRAAGARLLLLPLPDKSQVMPAPLGGRAGSWPENPGLEPFLARLAADGIDVIAASNSFVAQSESFLHQDTHWTPAAMEAVADLAAERLRPLLTLGGGNGWSSATASVVRVGDLVDALKLPAGQDIFTPEHAIVHPVRDRDGAPWSSAPLTTAPLLLLGDSFSNIYTVKAMGWGEAAGLGAQLALRLDRPVAQIAINGGAATAVRKALAEQGGPRPGQLVLWQFAVRDLAVEEWDPVTMPSPTAVPSPATAAAIPLAPAGAEAIEAEICETSRIPGDSSQYPDAWVDHLARLRRPAFGLPAGTWIILVCEGKRGNRPQDALGWRPGRLVTGPARPWRTVTGDAATWRRYAQGFHAIDTDEVQVPAFVFLP